MLIVGLRYRRHFMQTIDGFVRAREGPNFLIVAMKMKPGKRKDFGLALESDFNIAESVISETRMVRFHAIPFQNIDIGCGGASQIRLVNVAIFF